MDTPQLTDDRQFLSMVLVRLIDSGQIGVQQAAELRQQWQGTQADLPLDPEHFKLDDAASARAAFLLLSLGKKYRTGRRSLDEYREQLAAMQIRELLDLSEKAQDEYARKAKLLAVGLAAGSLLLAAWHRSMREIVTEHLLQRAMLGGGGVIREPERVERLANSELTFLQGFADTVALSYLDGKPLSEEHVYHRSGLYAGVGRQEFYRQQEARPDPFVPTPNGERVPAREPGNVAEYISQDDDGVCPACCAAHHDAESYGGLGVGEVDICQPGCQPCAGGEKMHLNGYYLVGTGPYPGTICWGRHRCRCKRVLRYLPDVYAELMRR